MESESYILLILVSAIAFLVFYYLIMRTPVTKTPMPTYCEACHTRVEYNHRRNGYFCPEHGQLIFLYRGIPKELISGWCDRLKEAED